jgi:hypothetical protein
VREQLRVAPRVRRHQAAAACRHGACDGACACGVCVC